MVCVRETVRETVHKTYRLCVARTSQIIGIHVTQDVQISQSSLKETAMISSPQLVKIIAPGTSTMSVAEISKLITALVIFSVLMNLWLIVANA